MFGAHRDNEHTKCVRDSILHQFTCPGTSKFLRLVSMLELFPDDPDESEFLTTHVHVLGRPMLLIQCMLAVFVCVAGLVRLYQHA